VTLPVLFARTCIRQGHLLRSDPADMRTDRLWCPRGDHNVRAWLVVHVPTGRVVAVATLEHGQVAGAYDLAAYVGVTPAAVAAPRRGLPGAA
jgi:hypothetical protein